MKPKLLPMDFIGGLRRLPSLRVGMTEFCVRTRGRAVTHPLFENQRGCFGVTTLSERLTPSLADSWADFSSKDFWLRLIHFQENIKFSQSSNHRYQLVIYCYLKKSRLLKILVSLQGQFLS